MTYFLVGSRPATDRGVLGSPELWRFAGLTSEETASLIGKTDRQTVADPTGSIVAPAGSESNGLTHWTSPRMRAGGPPAHCANSSLANNELLSVKSLGSSGRRLRRCYFSESLFRSLNFCSSLLSLAFSRKSSVPCTRSQFFFSSPQFSITLRACSDLSLNVE